MLRNIAFLSLLILYLTQNVYAQETQSDTTCYGPGSIATAVIVTFLITLALTAAGLYYWKKYKEKRQEHLILETDPEKGKGEYAFDNPGFKDASLPSGKAQENQHGKRWNWSPLSALTKTEKRKTLDDTAVDDYEVKVIALRSHDFTGLGFNICGNMKEGIFIKDILHRGPAFESGKLNSGDRIHSVTISFEHMVYEDALTILSYASPYEVMIEAKSGKLLHSTPGQGGHPSHPVYRSSSCVELYSKSKKKLFNEDGSLGSSYSSLQKSRSNMTTLERKEMKLTPEQLKKIPPAENQMSLRLEKDLKPIENKYQKFGIRVLPLDQKSPKSAEQNDNNSNIEITKLSVDEVDNNKPAPPVKKREKKNEEKDTFERDDTLNNSIKRDENGIPQEIPSHMFNAAMTARNNRKSVNNIDEDEGNKVKRKGKAPSPPEEIMEHPKEETKAYNSDSDVENDNNSSVNTIELNSSDITIHQIEDENRKTLSTGDLTKIKKNKKSHIATLERAQSLDISDQTAPKKRKTDSDDDIILNKEPRLSLILDGLNTFQRNRLKKSTEWGNLEDAILKLNQDDDSIISLDDDRISLTEQTPEFDAVVNKINEIKRESVSNVIKTVNNEIWPEKMEDEVKQEKITVKNEEIDEVPLAYERRQQMANLKVNPPLPKKVVNNKINEPFELNPRQRTPEPIPNLPTPPGDEIETITDTSPPPSIEFEISPKHSNISTPTEFKISQKHSKISTPTEFEISSKHSKISTPTEFEISPKHSKISTPTEFEISPKHSKISTPIEFEISPKHSKISTPTEFEISSKHSNISTPSEVEISLKHSNISTPAEIEISPKHSKISIPNSVEFEISPRTSRGSTEFEISPRTSKGSPPRVTEFEISSTPPKISTEIETTSKISTETEVSPTISKIFTQAVTEIEDSPKTSKVSTASPVEFEITNVSPSTSIELEMSPRTSKVQHTTDLESSPRTSKVSIKPEEVLSKIPILNSMVKNELKNVTDESKTGTTLSDATNDFLYTERSNYIQSDTNISDDIKVSRNSSLEPKTDDFKHISNVNVSNGDSQLHSLELSINEPSEFYVTALDKSDSRVTISTPDLIKNVTLAEALSTLNDYSEESAASTATPESSTLSYVTEIKVSPKGEVDVESGRSLEQDFENYVKSFESKLEKFESNIQNFDKNLEEFIKDEPKKIVDEKNDENEISKIQEIAEEQLKKLPEMKFTANYESKPNQEKRQSQIEILRSNFEKPKPSKPEITKSRIPIATTTKTPPTSPERRDSRNLDLENDKAILELMSSNTVTSTPKNPKSPSKNVTVTSIRNNSKIPSGLPVLNRPPIAPRRSDSGESNVVHISSNGTESSFKQWVFNPANVTNVSVTENNKEK